MPNINCKEGGHVKNVHDVVRIDNIKMVSVFIDGELKPVYEEGDVYEGILIKGINIKCLLDSGFFLVNIEGVRIVPVSD